MPLPAARTYLAGGSDQVNVQFHQTYHVQEDNQEAIWISKP